MREVVVYSTKTCHFCKDLKKFLDEYGIEFIEYDVAADKERRVEMIERSGQMGVPVLYFKDGEIERIVVGFNEDQLLALFRIHVGHEGTEM